MSRRYCMPSNLMWSDAGVGARHRLREIGAAADDGQHPPAGGDELTVAPRGSSVVDRHAGNGLRLVDPLDRPDPTRTTPDSRATRARRRRSGPCRTAPAKREASRHAPATSSGSSGSSISGRMTCVSGSPSRTLNSITFGPAVVSIRPTNRKPRNGWPSAAMPAITGFDDLAHDPRLERGIHQRARRERAHAAGVRPAVVVEDALVILRRADRDGARAVADREERHFRPDQAFFDHEPIAGGAEFPLAHGVGDRALGGGTILGDHHALAGRQSVGLQHHRAARTRRGAPTRAPRRATRRCGSARSECRGAP